MDTISGFIRWNICGISVNLDRSEIPTNHNIEEADMAANDRFERFNSSLSVKDRGRINDYIKTKGEELLVARSEDARVRLVDEYIREVNDLFLESK